MATGADPGDVRHDWLDPALALLADFQAHALIAGTGDPDALSYLEELVGLLEELDRELSSQLRGGADS